MIFEFYAGCHGIFKKIFSIDAFKSTLKLSKSSRMKLNLCQSQHNIYTPGINKQLCRFELLFTIQKRFSTLIMFLQNKISKGDNSLSPILGKSWKNLENLENREILKSWKSWNLEIFKILKILKTLTILKSWKIEKNILMGGGSQSKSLGDQRGGQLKILVKI